MLGLKSVGRGFKSLSVKSLSDCQLMLFSVAPSSTAQLNSQLVCLQPDGIFNLVMFI